MSLGSVAEDKQEAVLAVVHCQISDSRLTDLIIIILIDLAVTIER